DLSVALIPGATEYGLSPELVTSSSTPGETVAVNRHNLHGETDFGAAIDELQLVCPNLESVSLVVSWFGTDLRAGECKIKPMVVEGEGQYSQGWRVSGVDRGEAQRLTPWEERAGYRETERESTDSGAHGAVRDRESTRLHSRHE